jgi:hypothetical protein
MEPAVLGSLRFRTFVSFVVCAAVLTACSGDDDKAEPDEPAGNVATSEVAKHTVGKVALESAGPAAQLDKKTRRTLLERTQQYLDSAVNAPLTDGRIGDGYAPLFERALRRSATGADQDALTEMPVGKVDSFKATAKPVAISGLADQAGELLYLSTRFSANVKAETAAGRTTITRTTELTFAPDGDDWIIVAYRVLAARKAPSGTTTTTTADAGGAP